VSSCKEIPITISFAFSGLSEAPRTGQARGEKTRFTAKAQSTQRKDFVSFAGVSAAKEKAFDFAFFAF
jgi:hypothetical protein